MDVAKDEGFRQAVQARLSRSESGAGGGRRRLAEAVGHLRSGGKAIRARCVQVVDAVFRSAGSPGAELGRFSEAVELLHLGSLIHDDILDEAEVRRARPAVHVAFGTKVAVLAGDVALSRAGRLIADLGRPALSRKFAQVLGELCEGELLQDDHRWNPELTLAAYLDRVAKKSGGLFELACEGAAVLAGAGSEQTDRAARFGRELGCLFQVVDDLLDGMPCGAGLGKPAGRDLASGLVTLRAVLAIDDPRAGPPLRRYLLERGRALPASLDLDLDAPALVDRVRGVLADLAALTHAALAALPAVAARDELATLVDALAGRGQEALQPALPVSAAR